MSTFDNAYALIVGIAHYQHIRSLPIVVLNDTQTIYDALVDPQVCAYPSANVTLLTDAEATKAALRQALVSLAADTNANSTVFIYFSGHGAHLDGVDGGNEYLLPVDTSLATSSALVQTAISGSEVTQFLNDIPARKVVVIFDCCHAGGIGQPKDAQAPLLKAGLPDAYYEQLHKGRGRLILASSRSSEVSWVLPNDQHSLFTKHLVAGLRGGSTSDDGFIHIFELFKYLQPRVTGEHAQQHPIFKAEIEENFPIALYLGQQKDISHNKTGLHYDVFISYSTEDQEFAERLHADLQAKGVQCWFAPEDIQGGKKIHEQIDQAIRGHDKLLLVLSEHSMASEWVKTEIYKARQQEGKENKRKLFPIRLVGYEQIRQWEAFDADTGKDMAREVREYFIPDFTRWKDQNAYQKAFDRLLRDLKA